MGDRRKMGDRPFDFDDVFVRNAPPFLRWLQLVDGEVLQYGGRDFTKGSVDKEEEEERLMRRIMVMRRSHLNSQKKKDQFKQKGAARKRSAPKKKIVWTTPTKLPGGDPRMKLAMKLRMADPSLSPAAALLRGGYTAEQASSSQHRNQLSRRIRLETRRREKGQQQQNGASSSSSSFSSSDGEEGEGTDLPDGEFSDGAGVLLFDSESSDGGSTDSDSDASDRAAEEGEGTVAAGAASTPLGDPARERADKSSALALTGIQFLLRAHGVQADVGACLAVADSFGAMVRSFRPCGAGQATGRGGHDAAKFLR